MSSPKDTQPKIIKAETKVQVRIGETSLPKIIKAEFQVQVRIGEASLVLTMQEAEELYDALHSALGKPLTGWTPTDYILPNTTRIPYVFPTQKVEVGDRPDLAPTFVCNSGTVSGADGADGVVGVYTYDQKLGVYTHESKAAKVGDFFGGAKITYVGDDGFEAERVAHDGVNIETIKYGKDGAMISCRTTCVHVPPKPDPVLKSLYDNLRKERNCNSKDRDLAADIFDGSMSV